MNIIDPGPPRLNLTVSMVAELWEVSDTFVYHLLNSGQLAGFRLGNKLWRIKPQALEDYERAQMEAVAGSIVHPMEDRAGNGSASRTGHGRADAALHLDRQIDRQRKAGHGRFTPPN